MQELIYLAEFAAGKHLVYFMIIEPYSLRWKILGFSACVQTVGIWASTYCNRNSKGPEKEGEMNRRGENWSEKGRKTRRLTLLCNLMNALRSPRLACRIGRKLAHHVAGDHKTWYSVVSAEEKKWKGRISYGKKLGRMWLWGTKLG